MRGIKIKNLYGRFYYEIMLAEEGMTILTGPNGFGKSTILHMIGALANSDMEFFFDLPFSEIEVIGNGDDSNFVIRKEKESLFIDGKEFDRQRINEWKNPKGWLHLDGKFENMYSDHRTDEITKIVFTLKQITGNVFFIEEQRLVKSGVERRTRADGSRVMERRLIQTVKEISEKLRMKMNKTTKGYSAISNELDSTFPQRLFAQEVGLSEREFNEKLLSMREKVSKLQKYGISNVGKFDDILFKEDDARALKVYFDDFEMKYRQYENLINCLELYTEIINDRFLFKKILISINDGIHILDTDNEAEIPLEKLSSGEKETLVLFYQLIFEVSEDSILLIDEPEISLHIAWQRKFAEDIMAIIKGKKINVIIATHSVQIINGNRRIQRDLGEQYKNGLNKG